MSEEPDRAAPRMVPVLVEAGHLRAEVIRGRLEAAGIPVLLQYESLGLIMGLTADGLGEVKILVPEDCVEEARRVLATPAEIDPAALAPDLPADEDE